MSLSDVLPGLPGGQEPPRRYGYRQEQKRKRRRKRRAALAVLLAVVVVGGAVAASWAGLRPVVQKLLEPDDYTGVGGAQVTVQIAPGSSGVTIAGVLVRAGVVKTEKGFVNAVRKDPKAAGIQPGTYRLRKQMSSPAALAVLDDPKARITLSATVPEGKRGPDVLTLLSKQLGIPAADFTAALNHPADLNLPAAAKGQAEGFLYPSTYEFEPGVTAADVLTKMFAESQGELDTLGVPAARQREIVVVASILQAEAGQDTDMGKVARVIYNRLAAHKNLQLDSTVSFAVGRFGVTTTPAERAVKSPYNTYLNPGLPPGPIDSPGSKALQAALQPDPGSWLYFTTINPDTGETVFENTPQEHAADVLKLQQWLRAHPQATK